MNWSIFLQDFLSKIEQKIDGEKEYWSNADPFLKDELNYFLDLKTDGKTTNSEYDPRKSKPKQTSNTSNNIATEKPEQIPYNYEYQDDDQYAYYEDNLKQNPSYNQNEDVNNYYYDGNYYYDEYYDYYNDYYDQSPSTQRPAIKNKVPDFNDVIKNTKFKGQKPFRKKPSSKVKNPPKPSEFPPVPTFNEISHNVKNKVKALERDASKTPNFENVSNAVKKKNLEVSKLAPNFADVFKYPIYQKEGKF